MLNAFRHQGGGHHSPAANPLKPASLCSTPFGIREGDTSGQAVLLGWRSRVLNAFRHQGGGHHSPAANPLKPASLCSTPFGIREGDTLADRGVEFTKQGAQRLSASGRGTPGGPFARTRENQCAQRLSASGRGTPIALRPQRWQNVVCSTPFGIREGDTHVLPDQLLLSLVVLNAFRHQGGGHSA